MHHCWALWHYGGIFNRVYKNSLTTRENPQSLPDICDDDKMFAVSLVAVEIRVAHLHGEVYKLRVFHLGLRERWEVVGFCPFNDSPVPWTQSTVSAQPLNGAHFKYTLETTQSIILFLASGKHYLTHETWNIKVIILSMIFSH